ncbi:MAG: PLP-dependent aminotransferase family protein [Acidobacteriota bacterium]|nr:PLP-dependent aminotransferase family protein [Acidobacteriota bacterium]
MKPASSVFLPPIAFENGKGRPLYRQLHDWFQRAIASGQLRPGQRVPSTRALAAELNISRIPVLNAYEQLHAEGYLETFVGAGTRVATSIPRDAIAASPAIGRPAPRKARRRISQDSLAASPAAPQPWLHISGAFRMHVPALDQFPVDVWSRLVARNARKLAERMAYGDPMGYAPLREAIAEYLRVARAVRCGPSQVMIVAGSQQGLQLSARVLLNPGDPVWIEEPGYPGARQAFATARARLIPVPVDKEGLNVAEGIRRCRNARAVYITPSHQYPLGATLSAARRVQLLDWASRSCAWIIEDDYDCEFRHGNSPMASVQGLDPDARVVHVGTFSKALFPAIRLGHVVVPSDLVPAFARARQAADIFPSTLYQAVLSDFIAEGHFARHARRMRMLYSNRCIALVLAIRDQMDGMLDIIGADAGMHLAGLLPRGMDDTTVARKAAENGVAAMPLSTCCLKRPSRGGLVLGYGAADIPQIQAGVRRLKMILCGEMSRRKYRPAMST